MNSTTLTTSRVTGAALDLAEGRNRGSYAGRVWLTLTKPSGSTVRTPVSCAHSHRNPARALDCAVELAASHGLDRDQLTVDRWDSSYAAWTLTAGQVDRHRYEPADGDTCAECGNARAWHPRDWR